MNKQVLTILLVLSAFSLCFIRANAQVLLHDGNMPCSGDSFIVYQQPYVEFADSGTNCIWDFSFLLEDNAISLNYYDSVLFENDILCKHQETELIYYQNKSDTIYVVGRESALFKLTYHTPMPIIKFPFRFGDTIVQPFTICAEWGNYVSQTTTGDIRIKADATGQLILSTDTLDSIIRVSTREKYNSLNTDTLSLTCYSWKWYSQRYRQPIVETVKVLKGDSISIAYSLYYPVLYDSTKNIKRSSATHPRMDNDDVIISDVIIDNMTYQPNPVVTDLLVNYRLHATTSVSVVLYSAVGICVYYLSLLEQESGCHNLQIPMDMLPSGVYTLCINTSSSYFSAEIIKR